MDYREGRKNDRLNRHALAERPRELPRVSVGRDQPLEEHLVVDGCIRRGNKVSIAGSTSKEHTPKEDERNKE